MQLKSRYAKKLHRKYPVALESWGNRSQDRPAVEEFRAAGDAFTAVSQESSIQGWPTYIRGAHLPTRRAGYQALEAGVQVASPFFGGPVGFVLNLALGQDGPEADLRPAGSQSVGEPLKKLADTKFALPNGAELSLEVPADRLRTLVSFKDEGVKVSQDWCGSGAPRWATVSDRDAWVRFEPGEQPTAGCFHQDPHLETTFDTPFAGVHESGFRTVRWSEPRGGTWDPSESTSELKLDLMKRATSLMSRAREAIVTDRVGVGYLEDALEVGGFELEHQL